MATARRRRRPRPPASAATRRSPRRAGRPSRPVRASAIASAVRPVPAEHDDRPPAVEAARRVGVGDLARRSRRRSATGHSPAITSATSASQGDSSPHALARDEDEVAVVCAPARPRRRSPARRRERGRSPKQRRRPAGTHRSARRGPGPACASRRSRCPRRRRLRRAARPRQHGVAQHPGQHLLRRLVHASRAADQHEHGSGPWDADLVQGGGDVGRPRDAGEPRRASPAMCPPTRPPRVAAPVPCATDGWRG